MLLRASLRRSRATLTPRRTLVVLGNQIKGFATTSTTGATTPDETQFSASTTKTIPPSTPPASPASIAGSARSTPSQRIAEETLKITRNTLMPLNETYVGPLTRKTDDRIPLPVVLIVGNHSSGKSTFINYLSQRRIQEAGVAPTDDGFTVIAPGEKDVDQDGPSMVGDPGMGFSALRSFGPSLVHHLRLKVRTDLALKDIILIDSPGMIDSPTDTMGSILGSSARGRKDRGYDFQGVARWFAERADLILLFFDPDKPGTTGETLSVLTNSLSGMDHKFLIVMNKVDMFERSADFARSYGALCWNLSKVIPRKDLPRIYTTYTPLDTPYTNPEGPEKSSVNQRRSFSGGGPSKSDLDIVRTEIMNEIRNAPFRRIDNMITSVFDQTRLLKMHLEILEDVRSDFQRAAQKAQLLTAGVGLGGLGLGLGPMFLFGPELWSFSATVCISALLGATGLYMYNGTQLEARAKTLMEEHSLDAFFRKRFARDIAERDESTIAIWHRVRPQVRSALENFGLAKVPKVSNSALRSLDDILNNKIPELRKAASSRLGKVGMSSADHP